MKAVRIVFAVILVQLLVLKTSAQEGYVIGGNIPPSQNGNYIYLFGIDYSDLTPKIRDSVKIENGKFVFTGKINTPAILASI